MWMLKRAVEKHFGPEVVAGVKYTSYGDEKAGERVHHVASFHGVVVGLHVGDCIMLESAK